MRKTIASILLVLTTAVCAFAASLNIDPAQSGSVLCGSATSNPTQLLLNDPAATRTYIVNLSTNNVFIVGYSTITPIGISSAAIVSTSLVSGSFYIGAATTTIANGPNIPSYFSPDGPFNAYTGPMWCVGGGQGAVVQRIRTH